MDLRGGAFLAILMVCTALVAVPGTPAAETTANANVNVSNYDFSPSSVSIEPGDTVTWNWVSGTHNVETSDGSQVWCSTRSGGSCAKSFPDPGTYDYRCGIHPGLMQATVVVSGSSDPPTLTIDTPTDGAVVEDAFTAAGSAAHDLGIDAVSWRLADSTWRSVDQVIDTPEGVDWNVEIDVSAVPEGNYDLEIRAVSTDNQITVETVPVFVENPGFIDLVVAGFSSNNQPTFARLSATLRNTGVLPAENVDVAYQYQHHGTWRTIETLTVTLNAGSTLVRTVQWDAEGKIGSFPVRVVIDPDESIEDIDRTNNSRQTTASFVHPAVPGFDPFEPV